MPNGLAATVIGVVVAAVVAIVGVAVFIQVNSAQNPKQPLFDLIPLIIAAVVIIGASAGGLYFTSGQ